MEGEEGGWASVEIVLAGVLPGCYVGSSFLFFPLFYLLPCSFEFATSVTRRWGEGDRVAAL